MKEIDIFFQEEKENKTAKELLQELEDSFGGDVLSAKSDMMLVMYKTEDGDLIINFTGEEIRGGAHVWKLLGMLEWAKITLTEALNSAGEGGDDDEDD